MKLLKKIWLCYMWGFHDWTAKALRGELVDMTKVYSDDDFKDAYYDNLRMYCSKCGKESRLNKIAREIAYGTKQP